MPSARRGNHVRRLRARKLAAVGGLFFNEDGTQQYYGPEAGTMSTGHLDRIIDSLRGSQVRVFILCVNGKKAFYASRVWEPYWEGFDPKRGLDQPFMGGVKDPWFSRLAANLLALIDAGIDPPDYLLRRARQAGVKAWVSIRMNDGHARGQWNHPLNSRFYREHREYLTMGNTLGPGWDYAQEPVRHHMMLLVREVLERYQIDGLELDWLRSPNHFKDAEFARGRRILTAWMKEIRAEVDAAARSRGHPIVLSVRVPARPPVARGIGLDAVAWARHGLIDRLVVGPYKGTTDFDVPVEQWKRLLAGTGVPVSVSLEHVVSFYPGAPNCWMERFCMTREQLRGAAIGALHRGSDGVYLFNQMERPFAQPELFHELGALRTLHSQDRDSLQTWVSPEIPGRPTVHALPRVVEPNSQTSFRLYTGPRPPSRAMCTVVLTIAPVDAADHARVKVKVNGARAEQRSRSESPILRGQDRLVYAAPHDSLRDGYTRIAVLNSTPRGLKISGVEWTVRFGEPVRTAR